MIDEQATANGRSLRVSADLLASAAMAMTDGLALQLLADPGRMRPETTGACLCAHHVEVNRNS